MPQIKVGESMIAKIILHPAHYNGYKHLHNYNQEEMYKDYQMQNQRPTVIK